MLVSEVADRAADTAPHLHGVSTRDLRWRFAASLLDDGVPPDVVSALGGWDRLDRLDPLLDEPDAKPSSQPSTGRAGGRRQAGPSDPSTGLRRSARRLRPPRLGTRSQQQSVTT